MMEDNNQHECGWGLHLSTTALHLFVFWQTRAGVFPGELAVASLHANNAKPREILPIGIRIITGITIRTQKN